VFEELARAVFPSTLVDTSPSTVYSVDSMRRVLRFFPEARFIHLVRHTRSYCDSVVKYMHLLATPAYRPRERPVEDDVAPRWIRDLAH
jgi:Sulfotransferase family